MQYAEGPMRKILGLGLAAIAVAGAGIWALRAPDGGAAAAGFLPHGDPVVVAEGLALYDSYCAACHGADLAGQPDWQSRGPDGLLPAPPHDPTGHTWHHPDDVLFAITRDGPAAMVGGGYQSAMMGFGDILTDAEIIATLAYIKSTWPLEVIAIHDGINARAAAAP